jgi:restriction system protein
MAHQAAVADKNRQHAQAVAVKEQARRQREAERLRQQLERVTKHQFIMTEKEERQLNIAAQEAEVERLNGELALHLADIDNVLSATLEVERLRRPRASPREGEAPAIRVAVQRSDPGSCTKSMRPPSRCTSSRSRRAASAPCSAARRSTPRRWPQPRPPSRRRTSSGSRPQRRSRCSSSPSWRSTRRPRRPARRTWPPTARYDEECAQRQREADESNASLDELIRGLELGTPEAVEEYLGIVFGNSVYLAEWPWPPEYSYDADTKELSIQLEYPAPGDILSVRQYKYVRAQDEITTTDQTQKEQRERYTALANNMTLRTLHEVWEADRGGKVDSLSLVGSVAHVDPATGKDTMTPLVAVAVDRRTFDDIDLSRVAPAETMRHLGAVVSKNPHALTPIKLSPGVRAH